MATSEYPDADMLALGVARGLTGALRQAVSREGEGALLVASDDAAVLASLEALAGAELDWARVEVLASRVSARAAVAAALSRGPAGAARVTAPGAPGAPERAPDAVVLGANALGLPAGLGPPQAEGAFAPLSGPDDQAVTLSHLAKAPAIHLVFAGPDLAPLAEAAEAGAGDLGPALARLAPEAIFHRAP
ncbi:MAG: hypothetical protein JJU40_00065 [Rhodobacteraceae bacterium]|nr:hypothetical protein [Paracoccaceae bacterium]